MKKLGNVFKKGKKKAAVAPVGGVREISAEVVHHIGDRSSQQDSYGTSDFDDYLLSNTKGYLAIVADGMGGLANGSEVSGIVVASLLEQFGQFLPEQPASAQLLQMAYQSNWEVRQYISDIQGGMSGSTLVAVHIKENRLFFVSVGDSRIYLVRGGTILQLNREHVYLRELYVSAAAGNIPFDVADNDVQKESLTSYIGSVAPEHVDFNLQPVMLGKGDKVLLMSDGVFGTLSDEEICEIVSRPDFAPSMLEEAVLQKDRPGQDNFTAMVLTME